MFRKIIRSTRFLLFCAFLTGFTALYLGISDARKTQIRATFLRANKALTLMLYPITHKPLCPDCNIILVSLDTLSANHLPCYGYERNTAPNLCAFGKENIMFEHAYANAHFTLPSHVSMFTGLLPSAHGVSSTNHDFLAPTAPFLPSILHANGYETDFAMPTDDPNLPLRYVYNRGIDAILGKPMRDGLNYWTDSLQKLEANEQKKKKTLLFLHTYYVHTPYLLQGAAPVYTKTIDSSIPSSNSAFATCDDTFISYLKRSLKNDLNNGYWGVRQQEYRSLYSLLTGSADPTKTCKAHSNLIFSYRFNYFYRPEKINTQKKVEDLKALYDQKINELDEKLRVLFEFISRDDIKNNTILVITADHGEEFMEHGQVQHETLYDSNLRIPVFMYIPGVKKKEIDGIAQSIDLTPTLLDLVGVPFSDADFQGQSLSEAIKHNETSKNYAVAERESDGLKTIRNMRYKLFLKKVVTALNPVELYDTEKDPQEKTNILFLHPDIATMLKNKLIEILPR